MEPIIAAMKDAIAEVRHVALNLRPPSFDEFGLLATIQWLGREYQQRHPEVRLQTDLAISDEQVPQPLRIVLFRVIESIFHGMDSALLTIGNVRLALEVEQDCIVLVVEHDGNMGQGPAPSDDRSLNVAEERVLLSGGYFHVGSNSQGGRSLRAIWPL